MKAWAGDRLVLDGDHDCVGVVIAGQNADGSPYVVMAERRAHCVCVFPAPYAGMVPGAPVNCAPAVRPA